jgi:hypothetical protein
MSQLSILVSQESVRFHRNAVDPTPQHASTGNARDRDKVGRAAPKVPGLLAQRWQALRASLRRRWGASATDEHVARVWWPPLFSFATGTHVLLLRQRALIDERAKAPRDPESFYCDEGRRDAPPIREPDALPKTD